MKRLQRDVCAGFLGWLFGKIFIRVFPLLAASSVMWLIQVSVLPGAATEKMQGSVKVCTKT